MFDISAIEEGLIWADLADAWKRVRRARSDEKRAEALRDLERIQEAIDVLERQRREEIDAKIL